MRLAVVGCVIAWCSIASAQPSLTPPIVVDEPATATPSGDNPTGTVRAGGYHDSDQTTVWRFLGGIAQSFGQWELSAGLDIDAVTSASVDVRSSPLLSKVDTVTSASGRSSTSGGEMTDTRYQGTFGAGWKGSDGRAINLTSAVAKESDYESVSGGLNGSFDILDRTTTILGGVTLTDNRVSSVIDSTIHRKMFATAWSAGVARVLTPDDALRVRYDGKLSQGYIASPYRSVRFGDWMATFGEHQITFANALETLPEREPESRTSSALVGEWVHSLARGIGLHPELRVSHDSWDVNSFSAGIDLRVARPTWRLQTGYRFYAQSAANFFSDKYVGDASMYTFYTSDKELGSQTGHLGQLDVSWILIEPEEVGKSRLLLNLQVDVVHYNYPGFLLLSSRDSVFSSLGLSWEL